MKKIFKYSENKVFTITKNDLLNEFIQLTLNNDEIKNDVIDRICNINHSYKLKLLENKEFKQNFDKYCDYVHIHIADNFTCIAQDVLDEFKNSEDSHIKSYDDFYTNIQEKEIIEKALVCNTNDNAARTIKL